VHLVVEGVNFRAAPLQVRERIHMTGELLRGSLRRLGETPLEGGAILSTCNRTEFYVTSPDPVVAAEHLRSVVGQVAPGGEWADYSYHYRDSAALDHLFRVASGLDSAILGEAQVLGQFKGAHAAAREAGTLDARLDFLMRRAITVAKRIRTETAIGRNPVGFGHAAVAQARSIFGSLKGRSALLVGAGKMAGSTSRLLAAEGMDRIHFSTRTPARAMELATQMPSGVITLTVPFAHVDRVAAEVDLIICSTSSDDYVFTREMVEGFMRQRRRRPLFLLDLAVPRDVDPAVSQVEDAYLFNIDDLARIVQRGLQERESELPAAEAIIREEVARVDSALEQRHAAPVIAGVVAGADEARRLLLARHMPAGLTRSQEEAVERMTEALVARLLHRPISYLRAHPEDEEAAQVVRDLFASDHADPA
jgi:glutamyl-tRNA reductase